MEVKLGEGHYIPLLLSTWTVYWMWYHVFLLAVIFFAGRHQYKHVPPTGSLFTKVFKCILVSCVLMILFHLRSFYESGQVQSGMIYSNRLIPSLVLIVTMFKCRNLKAWIEKLRKKCWKALLVKKKFARYCF